jgi:hypothetical protein
MGTSRREKLHLCYDGRAWKTLDNPPDTDIDLNSYSGIQFVTLIEKFLNRL